MEGHSVRVALLSILFAAILVAGGVGGSAFGPDAMQVQGAEPTDERVLIPPHECGMSPTHCLPPAPPMSCLQFGQCGPSEPYVACDSSNCVHDVRSTGGA